MRSTPEADAPLVIVGRIRKAHGIRGELLIEPQTETPDAIFAPGARVFVGTVSGDVAPDRRLLRVEDMRPFKDLLLVTFEEIPDRTEAEKWRDRFLLVPESELAPPAEDEIFVHQLVGLQLMLSDGTAIGPVIGTFEVAGRLLLEIQRPEGTTLVPYELEFVDRVDLEARELVITPPDGMFD
ncbi:MAG: ribosome maturation factor RimM [Gemmatimonadaceae bacterium]